MRARSVRRRPPWVVVGWAAVLAVTVGLGVLGRAGTGSGEIALATVAPLSSQPAEATMPVEPPGRPPAQPRPTRPPIGEDGVIGGLVFGTAWTWLEPAVPEG